MFNGISNRKLDVEIVPHSGVYVTIIMRIQDCTENEKSLIMKKAKEFYQIAERYNGETYNLPYHTPIELGEVVFNNTFVFPNGELTERYVEAISNI